MSHRIRLLALVAVFVLIVAPATQVHATPYASGITFSGPSNLTVNFTLNEPSTALTYSINGGTPVALDGTTTGAKSFTLGSAADKFSIVANTNKAAGYSLPKVGTTLTATANHFTIDTQSANITTGTQFSGGQISSDANGLMNYNSLRGIDVSNNPNSANFGTAYVSNSADQTGTPLTGRTSLLNKGFYAFKADGSDAYGYGDTAQGQLFGAANANTPYRMFVADDGTPYMAAASDAISGVFKLSQDMTQVTQMFNGIDGPTDINIATNNHGSAYKTIVTGSSAAGNLKVYTLDEDLSSFEVSGTGFNDNTNRLWKYDMGSYDPTVSGPYTAPPVSVTPDAVRGPLLDGSCCALPGVFITFINMDLGKDGKFYLSQNRSAGDRGRCVCSKS